MGVEWAGRPEPADADPPPGRAARRHAGPDAGQAADRNSPGAGAAADRHRLVALTDPVRRAAEHLRYRAVAERSSDAARWSEALPGFRAGWEKIKVKYGYAERGGSAAQPTDGSWRGAGGRRLDDAQNREIDQACGRIREVAERAIIPGVRAVEAQDPTRRLARLSSTASRAQTA